MTAIVEPDPKPANPAETPQKFDTAGVATISFGHLVHDSYPSFLGPLLPLLIEKHGFSFTVAGGLITLMRAPTLIQPFLGYWADRTDARYWVILAPTTTALGMSLLGLAPNYLGIVLLLLMAGLSHSAFHPAGAAMATRLSGRSWGRGTSFFMTGGELGRAIGPLFIASCVYAFGLEGSWIAVGPAVLASLLLYWRLGHGTRLQLRQPAGGLVDAFRSAGRGLALIAAVILFRNLAHSSIPYFFPTFVTNAGGSLVYASLGLTVYEIAGATGAFFGGTISDRFGRRRVLALSQALAVPTLVGAVLAPEGVIQLALLVVAGLAVLSGGPVQLTFIQELLPRNRSLATGIMMFLGFEGTIVATLGVGFVADLLGLQQALLGTIALSALSIPFVLLLPEPQRD